MDILTVAKGAYAKFAYLLSVCTCNALLGLRRWRTYTSPETGHNDSLEVHLVQCNHALSSDAAMMTLHHALTPRYPLIDCVLISIPNCCFCTCCVCFNSAVFTRRAGQPPIGESLNGGHRNGNHVNRPQVGGDRVKFQRYQAVKMVTTPSESPVVHKVSF